MPPTPHTKKRNETNISKLASASVRMLRKSHIKREAMTKVSLQMLSVEIEHAQHMYTNMVKDCKCIKLDLSLNLSVPFVLKMTSAFFVCCIYPSEL